MRKKLIKNIRNIIFIFVSLALATLIGNIFINFKFSETNVVLIYIFSVFIISRCINNYIYDILSSILSTLLYNWFFTKPYYTFKVNDPKYFLTFFIMLTISLFTSTLTTKFKKTSIKAQEKEAESNFLYKITNHLADAKDKNEIAQITIKILSSFLNCNCAFICCDENCKPEKNFLQQKNDKQIYRKLENFDNIKTKMNTNFSNYYEIDDEFYNYPILNNDNKVLAVLRLPIKNAKDITDIQKRMIHSINGSISLAIERLNNIEAKVEKEKEITKQRYRSNMLRSISHDLRTPLAGIMGSSEMLMNMVEKSDQKYEIALGIYNETLWLSDLIENILSLTKLQDGTMLINKNYEAVEEIIEIAISIIKKRSPETEIKVKMPKKLILVPMDAKLILQVLLNLLDNAIKNTKENKKIDITIRNTNDKVNFIISDNGKGINEEDLPKIFDMFYTTKNGLNDYKKGLGLGLCICQTIIKTHGGNISAKNKKSGGAEFSFYLPLKGE